MAGLLSKAIRNNIITQAIKQKNNQEKIGEVISGNKDSNSYTVAVITRDGIATTKYDVKVQTDSKGGIPWHPEPGDYVKLSEQNKRFVIVGKIDINTLQTTSLNLLTDIYANSTGGGGGNIGI